ncbi:cyclin-dependent kinase 14-like isoform X3 [Xenia sp. Carnegie-2017]|uniref:cyclin-dependent kinase 14-like isoform X3 n=1 Tax=Xenia sp. Carnegie-2017 TaxID=2897299 RepID=UPI001F041C4D|nr:cyclin-dependent kinase 14-like isoform X3 [Xenia sp. Carnegie-2017]
MAIIYCSRRLDMETFYIERKLHLNTIIYKTFAMTYYQKFYQINSFLFMEVSNEANEIKHQQRKGTSDDSVNKRTDSKIKKLRKRVSQGLRLSLPISLAKEENAQDDHMDKVPLPDQTETTIDIKKTTVRRVLSDTTYLHAPQQEILPVRTRQRLRRTYSENAEDDPRPRSRSVSFTSPPESPFGKMNHYEKLELLGEGSYASVFKGTSNITNQTVALKEIRLQLDEGAPFTAIREASLLQELKHANVVKLHDIVHTKETLMFVLFLNSLVASGIKACERC